MSKTTRPTQCNARPFTRPSESLPDYEPVAIGRAGKHNRHELRANVVRRVARIRDLHRAHDAALSAMRHGDRKAARNAQHRFWSLVKAA